MKNFLKNNIVEILAIAALIQFVAVNLLVLFHAVKAAENTTIIVITSSTNIVIIVMSFYFGSSKSSKDKQAKIDELEQK